MLDCRVMTAGRVSRTSTVTVASGSAQHVGVTFNNPDTSTWSYGIIVREGRLNEEHYQTTMSHRIVLTHEGNWELWRLVWRGYVWGNRSEWEMQLSGDHEAINVASGQSNLVTLYSRTEDTDYRLFINGAEIAEVGEALASNIEGWHVTRQYRSHAAGWRHQLWASTRTNYEGLCTPNAWTQASPATPTPVPTPTQTPIPPSDFVLTCTGRSSGTLPSYQPNVAVVVQVDRHVEVTLVNPDSETWEYGLSLRNGGNARQLIITHEGEWQIRDGKRLLWTGDSESGVFNTGAGERNQITLYVTGKLYRLYVNGTLDRAAGLQLGLVLHSPHHLYEYSRHDPQREYRLMSRPPVAYENLCTPNTWTHPEMSG